MAKVKISKVAGAVVRRVVNPVHLYQAFKLHRDRKRNRRAVDDAQLQLYADLLPHLHFGYFDNPTLMPDRTSVGDITDAQHRYADRVLSHVTDKEHPVLDVGCGVGGLSGMLQARGFVPIAMSPDKFQVKLVAKNYPGVKVIRSKFEEFNTDEYARRIGTVLNSESLQYLKLDAAIAQVTKLLRPGGRWVVCDFFYRYVCDEKSCHVWDEFQQRLAQNGLKVTYQEDITENVLPTLRFVHMWATRLGIPMMEFSRLKFRRKNPGLAHLFDDAFQLLQKAAIDQTDKVNADLFQERHVYMLLVIEHANIAADSGVPKRGVVE